MTVSLAYKHEQKHVQFLQHPFEDLLHALSLAIKIKMRMGVSRVHGDVWRLFSDVTLEVVPSLNATTTSASYHPPSKQRRSAVSKFLGDKFVQ